MFKNGNKNKNNIRASPVKLSQPLSSPSQINQKQQQQKEEKQQQKQKQLPLTKEKLTLETLHNHLKQLSIIGERYKLKQCLGEGSFGIVYLAEDLQATDKANNLVAVKFEVKSSHSAQLKNEHKVYQLLHAQAGFPEVYKYGNIEYGRYMVIQLMGSNLDTLMKQQSKLNPKLSLKTVLLIANQLITLIEKLHRIGYIHRDIKPENILVGAHKHNRHLIHLLDMGLAKQFIDSKTKEHVPFKIHTGLSGTARYASINAHIYLELSRRDDIESIIFVLIYLARGCLPWQGFKGNRERKYQMIMAAKLNMELEEICSKLDIEFTQALKYARSLKFDDVPDYDYLRQLFNNCAHRHGYDMQNYRYDWTLEKSVAGSSSSSSKVSEQNKSIRSSSHKKKIIKNNAIKNKKKTEKESKKQSEVQSSSNNSSSSSESSSSSSNSNEENNSNENNSEEDNSNKDKSKTTESNSKKKNNIKNVKTRNKQDNSKIKQSSALKSPILPLRTPRKQNHSDLKIGLQSSHFSATLNRKDKDNNNNNFNNQSDPRLASSLQLSNPIIPLRRTRAIIPSLPIVSAFTSDHQPSNGMNYSNREREKYREYQQKQEQQIYTESEILSRGSLYYAGQSHPIKSYNKMSRRSFGSVRSFVPHTYSRSYQG